jgi:hypothetical protein
MQNPIDPKSLIPKCPRHEKRGYNNCASDQFSVAWHGLITLGAAISRSAVSLILARAYSAATKM